ncbi:MAG TPA: nitrite/sulfite reductase [Actinomycetota bacterium]|nr:nitrite/sulfite reductase [Actinomycetota bacterium]
MSEDRRFGTGTGEPRPLREEPSWEQVLAKNSIERLKKEKQPVGIVHEIPALAAMHYLDVSEEDIVRLTWYGLYHDKPKTGSFMMRIKVPSGLLPPQSLRAIGEVAQRFTDGRAELSTRQNVQLHFVKLTEVPEILATLRDAGLTTAGACGDAVRNITGCPLGGVLATEAFDVSPLVERASSFFSGNPEYMDLPRKHKITISACPAQCDMPEINCIALVGVVRDGRNGFAVRVGGGLSTVPRLSRDLGVWVPEEEALDVLRAILDAWKEDRRYRQSRIKARLKFMVDDYGPEGIREQVEARLGRRLIDGEAPEPEGFADHMGFHPQKQDGLVHLGVPVSAGLISGEQLIQVADLAWSFGGDARITKQQNLILTGVPSDQVADVTARLADIGFAPGAHPLHATAIACTGEPHCNYSVTETKGKMQEIVAHLESRWGDRLDGFRLNLDGCPHACALHWVGDIGLMGTTAREAVNGERQAYDLFLRGGTGPEQAIGRPLVRRVAFPLVESTLDRLIGAWLDGRGDRESFRDFSIRTPDDRLVAIATGRGGERR